ncbi:MAG: riboflavin synthase [Candidatus Omnitrophica bacterium]|nr:riboflavin synthase [Candidatus Omnitrophota bacterium]
MFTGIIEEIGLVSELIKQASSAVLCVKADKILSDTKIGDSISVNGVCLTIVEKSGNILKFDVSPETLDKTDLGNLKSQDKVNLERALKADSRLGGHFVAGHIDCIGKIKAKASIGDTIKIAFDVPQDFMKYIASKGSVAIDGISLTVGEVFRDYFTVYIIPHTLKNTTLSFKREGDSVNLETDILAKYTETLLSSKEKKSNITPQFLSEHGFV